MAGLWSNYEPDDDEWYLFWRRYAGPGMGAIFILVWGVGVDVIEGATLQLVVTPALGIAAWFGYLVWQEDITWRRRLAMVCLGMVTLGLVIGAVRTLVSG